MPDPLALLDGIEGLAGARVLGQLGGGAASQGWRVHIGGDQLVLRADRPLARHLGLDRRREWDILQAAHAAGLGPEPVWADPSRGLLVTRWIEGRQWLDSDLDDHAQLRALGALLRRVHALPGPGAPFDPVRAAEAYARATHASANRRIVGEVARLSADLYPADRPRCLCHHDPSAANIIGTGPPRLIDWEYAAAGRPLFDLAVVIRYHGLDRIRAEVLLEACCSRVDGALWEELRAFERLYALLAGLWQQVVSGRRAG